MRLGWNEIVLSIVGARVQRVLGEVLDWDRDRAESALSNRSKEISPRKTMV